jgi:hypothetical protein
MIVKENLITMRSDEWKKIRKKILDEYGPTYAISWVLKRELGFTVRKEDRYDLHVFMPTDYIHLDFFDSTKQSFFQLKYI